MPSTLARPALLAGLLALAGADASAQEHHHTGPKAPAAAPGETPLYDNLGSLHLAISTRSPKAQQYFDQGLRLTFAFNHEEAINSFREAVRQDSACAMCWWGIANALGPNINAPMDTSVVRPAWDAISNARSLSSAASRQERALIRATATRYSANPAAPRATLDSAYARAMRVLVRASPNDVNALVLYAESLMDLSPWNYWSDRGATARPGTREIVRALERAVAREPNHPGACHFYIHAIEASSRPARALPCADRLAKLMPGAGHLVHMPSHIYMRTGRYDLVAEHNHDAVAEDESFIQDRRPSGFYQFTYYPHNYHMMWAGLSMLGRGADAIAAARKVSSVIPAEVVRQAPPLEFFLPTPYFALARFERWDELLREPAPAKPLRYATGMWQYTRGLAFAARGDVRAAKAAADSVRAIAAAIPAEQLAGINSARALLAVGSLHLAGEIALAEGDSAEATSAMREAIRLEDQLTYDEPPPWYHPIRQRLGTVLVATGDAAGAERLFREDLEHYPENGWSLHGLAEAIKAQGRGAEAAAVEGRFARAWDGADMRIAEVGR